MSPGCIRPRQPHRHDPPGRAAGRLACRAGEAARLTGLSRDLPGDQMRRGDLACITAGRRRLITADRQQQFLGLGSQDTTSVRPATGSRAGHGQRPQEGGLPPDLPLDDRRIERGLAEAAERGSPTHPVTAGGWPSGEHEAHARDVGRDGQNLPGGSRASRNRQASAARQARGRHPAVRHRVRRPMTAGHQAAGLPSSRQCCRPGQHAAGRGDRGGARPASRPQTCTQHHRREGTICHG